MITIDTDIYSEIVVHVFDSIMKKSITFAFVTSDLVQCIYFVEHIYWFIGQNPETFLMNMCFAHKSSAEMLVYIKTE